jgi:hypothetical protein
MANHQVDNPLGVTDKRFGRGGSKPHGASTVTNTGDIPAMRARLTAISGTSYTAARLETMTENDMLYAIRLADEAAGIK